MLGSSRTPGGRGLPPELSTLLSAPDASAREQAWGSFVDRYHRLILGIAREVSTDYDGAMDRYVHVLHGLKKDDFRRLRGYAADSRGKFTTWLVVVTRRMCEDFRRARYGRERPSLRGDGRVADRQATRRRLTELVAAEIDPALVPDGSREGAELVVRRRELTEALAFTLSGIETRDQLLLELRFTDGLSAREIAKVVGLPTPFHVYRRINAILKELRAALESRGVTDPAP